jgi:hypothetical protein
MEMSIVKLLWFFLWREACYAQDAAEALGARIEDEDPDGRAEAEELREALERVQAITLEISEGLDADQERHAR